MSTRGYKDGLQPESLADGNWLVKQNQPVSKIKTKMSTCHSTYVKSKLTCHQIDNQNHTNQMQHQTHPLGKVSLV
jgi:hypothetical protein